MILQALAAIVGEPHLLRSPEDLVRYDSDGRQAGGHALAVARPCSVEQVSAMMRVAARSGIRFVPQGARTGLVAAGLAQDDVILSLERLNGAPTIDPLNRSTTVDAGVHLSALNSACLPHGLHFPIDLGADPSIGGMIATNTGGARLLRYGDVRRNLLGLQMVLADGEGTIVTFGRGLWKDNSSLDLRSLTAGSAGALGVITQATLALQPIPAARLTALLALDGLDDAIALLTSLERNLGMLLTAFEGMSRNAIQPALTHMPSLRLPFANGLPNYAVLIELSAGAAFTEDMLEDALAKSLAPWMEDGHERVRDVVIDRHNGLWSLRHALPEGLRAKGRVIGCDIALPRGEVARFRHDLAARLAIETPALELCDFGHVGDGGMHFNLVWPNGGEPYDPTIAERARSIVFRATVEDYGGSFSAEHGIGPVNAAYYEEFQPIAERRLAGRIQRVMASYPIGRVDFEKGLRS